MPPRRTGATFSEPIDLTEDIASSSKPFGMTSPTQSGRTHTASAQRVLPFTPSSTSRTTARAHLHSPLSGSQRSESSPSKQLKRSSRKSHQSPASDLGTSSEKRLRRFRAACPQAVYEIYQRATTQRFFVLERYRVGTSECPEEIVELTGSTGNIYLVHIRKQPRCTCPHAEQGNQCKHVLYVLAKVLNAPYLLTFQLALLSSELRQIFENAPPIAGPSAAATEDKNRKPIEGDCPICFGDLDAQGGESVVWCRAACGQNMHRECFTMWAKSKAGETTCPFCRTVWEGDKDLINAKKIDRQSGRLEEGYVNIRDQLPGVSGVRDVSTYSRWSPYMGRGRSRHYH